MLAPGSVIGILGSGQLGRMTALAAANLGYRVHVFAPDANGPAHQVCDSYTQAEYGDTDALSDFAAAVDVVTYEFENVPVTAAETLEEKVAVCPGPEALRVAQHRLREKAFAGNNGVDTAAFHRVASPADITRGLERVGLPARLKTCRLGYDGKGQIRLMGGEDPERVWSELNTDEAILEAEIPFEREVSVIVARRRDGTTCPFPVAENEHRSGILHRSVVPALAAEEVQTQAIAAATTLADALQIVGLLAVEFFVTKDGAVLFNEMAPRPHNSGHWSMDGCVTSQFEQVVRCVTDLPFGAVDVIAPTEMTNLIGDDVHAWPTFLQQPDTKLHLYGKAESRPGRKMGHINKISL